jgi:hypothetical protein
MHYSPVPPERTTRMVYAVVPMGVGRDCDWTATSGQQRGVFAGFRGAAICRAGRLEFAAFSVKSMLHDIRG